MEMVLKKSTLDRIGRTFVGANFGKTLAFRPMIIDNIIVCRFVIAIFARKWSLGTIVGFVLVNITILPHFKGHSTLTKSH